MIRPLRAPRPLDPDDAREYVLRLLGRRAYTVAELRDRLVRRGLPPAETEALLARLVEVGLLDDAAYARRWVEDRGARRGGALLRHELVRRGVDEDLVEGALARRDERAEHAAAVATLRANAWRYRDPGGADDDARRRAAGRAFALLARRGFAPEAAHAAVEAVLGEAPEDTPGA